MELLLVLAMKFVSHTASIQTRSMCCMCVVVFYRTAWITIFFIYYRTRACHFKIRWNPHFSFSMCTLFNSRAMNVATFVVEHSKSAQYIENIVSAAAADVAVNVEVHLLSKIERIKFVWTKQKMNVYTRTQKIDIIVTRKLFWHSSGKGNIVLMKTQIEWWRFWSFVTGI